MKTYLIMTLSILLVSFTGQAQKDTPFEKEFFKDRKPEFKEARKQYEEGVLHFDGGVTGYPEYHKALKFLEKAYAFNPNSSDLNYRIGMCHFRSSHKYKALEFYETAYKLNPSVRPDIRFRIGEALHIQYKFDEAIKEFDAYRKTLNQRDHMDAIYEVNKRIEECRNGKEFKNNPVRVWIDNLGANINGSHAEYAPLIATDESSIFFTSRREDSQGGELAVDDEEYFEDIYRAENVNGKWQPAVNVAQVNTETHDATAGLSPDGNTLFVYRGGRKDGNGDIYVSTFEEGAWSKPKHLGKNVNTNDYHESSAFLTSNGKSLYFVSDKPEGIGGHDIYKSDWNEEKERWGPAENLGPVINTKYDETGAFIHPDGKTLYFSSRGHESMGGFDIFYSVYENGVWSKPKNVGYPVNTPDDDVHFVVSANGRTGYFASFHEDGHGEKDLFKVTFLGPEKMPLLNNEDNLIASVAKPVKERVVVPKVEVRRSDVAVLKGITRDEKTKSPVGSIVEIVDNETNEVVTEVKTSGETGKYLVTLPAGKNYGMAVKSDGYLFHSENFKLPKASGYREYKKDIDLKKVEVGKSIVLRNIFFDLDKATLRPESKAELERLIKLMNENPTLRIEISGHTDTRGDDNYNQKLSERRSESVVNYLVDHGIGGNRLEFAGYGEKNLIVTDAEIYKLPKHLREEAHQQNRRTEFKILSK